MTLLTRFVLATTPLLLLAGCVGPRVPVRSESKLCVTIPYGSQDALAAFHPTTRHGNAFYVLLTNVQREPVRLWQEWCSWGYDCLQFEVTEPNGSKHRLKKKPTAFYRNFPDWVELASGESVVWKVELSALEWEDLSWLPKDRVTHVKLRALFGIDEDVDSKEHQIWIGHEASSEYHFILSAPR